MSDNAFLVEGFYDKVAPLSAAEDRAAIAAVPFDEAALRRQVGVDALVAKPGYTPQEHMAAYPPLEVNGIWGGFQGEGTKTVLPSEAHAKITCRLVPDQGPATIRGLLAACAARRHRRGPAAAGHRPPLPCPHGPVGQPGRSHRAHGGVWPRTLPE